MAGQFFRDEAGEDGAIHSHEVGQISFHHLAEDGFDLGVIAAEGEDAPAGEEIEVLVSVGIPEVAPFAADVALIEADRSQHLHKRRVDVVIVQFVLPPRVLLQPSMEIRINIRLQRRPFRAQIE